MDAAFKQIALEQINNRQVQKYKYHYFYSISAIIAANTTTPFTLAIEQDADFVIEKWTGSCYGPVDANGIQVPAGATDFPQPGTTTGFAGRGLLVKLTDTGSGKDLSDGFIPLECLLSPGYGVNTFAPYPAKYFARRNSKIRFDFKNKDTQARQAVDMVLGGQKYQMPEMPDTLNVAQEVAKGRQSV